MKNEQPAAETTEPLQVHLFSQMVSFCEVDSMTQDILLAHKVISSGMPNHFSCRIPLRTKLNISAFEALLMNYHDYEIVEWLRYGFSVSRDYEFPDPVPSAKNHKGATDYPAAIMEYLNTEIKLGATIGPFLIPPFTHRIGVSLLNTCPK